VSPEKAKSGGNSALADPALALELFSIAGSLNATPDLDYLLQKIGAAAERLLDSEASAIMLVTEDKKSLFFKVAGGEAGKKLKTMVLPIGQGIAGWVAAKRKPELVADCQKDARFAGKFDKASGFVTRSLICVPMILHGDLIGVVEVLNKRSGSYTEEHRGLLSSLAGLASVAISNTRLRQEQQNFISNVLDILGGVIESSRPGMADHPTRAARLACAIAKSLSFDEYSYRMVYYAGLLHDIGYVGFRNPRLLAELGIAIPTESQHPIVSCRMLEGIHMLSGAIPMIQHHHEYYDGSGYPGKLQGEQIPPGARVLSLVEALEDLRMAGLAGEELSSRAIQEIQNGRKTRFDPDVVDAAVEFLKTQGGAW